MLEFQNVAIRYEKELLSKLSFALRGGEVSVLLGANGTGKTSLLRAVLGEVHYTGDITLGGTPLQALPAKERATRISLLPQHLPAPALAVREVVALGLAPHVTRPSQKEWQTVDETLDRLSLTRLSGRAVCSLSGGERQKVFLAMLLVQNTPVLLLDEPTTYLDPAHRAQLFKILAAEAKRGKAILAVLHDLSEAVAVADRILLLDRGTLAFDGTPERFVADKVAERTLGMRHYTAKRDKKTAHFFAPEYN
ncbi:MAG: ABC transporter ATP-binding protein [Clostridia bacterium]|nr:ABC transporter ATP-binding protein [Clostridia bacterium]